MSRKPRESKSCKTALLPTFTILQQTTFFIKAADITLHQCTFHASSAGNCNANFNQRLQPTKSTLSSKRPLKATTQ